MSRKLRVLNVEDSEQNVTLIRHHLSRAGYELIWERVETSATMKTALEEKPWDVILSDYSMPQFNALQALQLVQEMDIDIPFIIISATLGEESAVEAMRAGAHDYLMKDNLRRLAPAIERGLQEANNRRARRQAEAALRESEDRYRDLIEYSHELIYTHDLEGRILSFNQAALQLMGYDQGSLLPQNIRQLIFSQYQHEFDDYLAELQQKGEARGVMAVQTRSGEKRLLEYHNTLRTEGVAVPIVRGMAHDVTEQRRGEKILRTREQRFRSLIENSSDAIALFSLDGTILYASPSTPQVTGFTPEEFVHFKVVELIHPDDLELVNKRLILALKQPGVGISAEARVRHKDGSWRWLEGMITNLLEEPSVAAIVDNYRDITERKRVEEMHLRRVAQAALRADINGAFVESDSALQQILFLCTEAIVQHLGAAFARLWTLNQEENVLELQASSGLYTHIDGPHARVPVGAFEIGLIAEERHSHITNDVQNDPRVSDKEWAEQEGMIAFAGYPLLVSGRLVGVVAMFARQQLAEDTLEALASIAYILSQGIERKRTEEALRVSGEQLLQAQKMEAIGQLAGGIAHDFNNLLTAITGYSQLTLRQLAAEDPLRPNLEEIKKAGDRAAALTRQLLTFSRKQVLQPKVLDLNVVVSEIEKMLCRLIGENIELQTALAPDLGSVKGDPGQIEQVIVNLAVNARDAMQHGGKLTIETANVYLNKEYVTHHVAVQPGHYTMLAVSDTGMGMDEQTRQHIFEPFFTTKESGKGTGLGLSTVYGIVKQSGGNIWVYSEVGRGTTFKVYLPRLDEEAQEYTPSIQPSEALAGLETILLAEDEEIVRKLVREILKSNGYQVLEAASGSEALLLCEHHQGPIHLLLTDVIMPEMSGRQLTEHLAQLRPEMKVLYMSGYTDDTIVRHGILESDIAFLQKPFTTDALARKVREVLD